MRMVLVIGLVTVIVLYILGTALIAWLWWRSGRGSSQTVNAASRTRRQSMELWSTAASALRAQRAVPAPGAVRGQRRALSEPPASGQPTPLNLTMREAERRREARTSER
jgi:hypothetical protein